MEGWHYCQLNSCCTATSRHYYSNKKKTLPRLARSAILSVDSQVASANFSPIAAALTRILVSGSSSPSKLPFPRSFLPAKALRPANDFSTVAFRCPGTLAPWQGLPCALFGLSLESAPSVSFPVLLPHLSPARPSPTPSIILSSLVLVLLGSFLDTALLIVIWGRQNLGWCLG